MAPKRFGKYEVLARIATGGAANIFLARQAGVANFQKLVCLKVLLPERASDADFVAMFLDEARLAARLNHPNCVQIFDLGRVRGSYYISMEYIFGETLWNLLATVSKLRTPLPASHVASIIASACDGLHHAHELRDSSGRPYNLVHRDVSPQNVMVTFEGQTKVLDFGIAKAETGRDPTMAGIVKGKFSYMSPEQITGSAIDRRSDIYSLGIVLFECLASRRLYRGETPEEIARLILEHRAPRLRDVVPDIPAELDAICATALSRQPGKRYQTAHAMGEALRDYLESIRHSQNSAPIAKLIDERFKGQIAARRKVCEAALAGTQDDAQLLKALDARPVREIDLFPEDESPEVSSDLDFNEPSGTVDAPLDLSSGSSGKDTIQGDEATGVILGGGGGGQVEGKRSEGHGGKLSPRVVSALTDPNLDESPEQNATRIDPGDVQPGGMELDRVEATNIDFQIEANGGPELPFSRSRASEHAVEDALPFAAMSPLGRASSVRAGEGGRSAESRSKPGRVEVRARSKEASDSVRLRSTPDSSAPGKAAKERGRALSRPSSDLLPSDLIESASGLSASGSEEEDEDEAARTQQRLVREERFGRPAVDEDDAAPAGAETEDLISKASDRVMGSPVVVRGRPVVDDQARGDADGEDAAEARTPPSFAVASNAVEDSNSKITTGQNSPHTEPEVTAPGRYGLFAVLAALALGLAVGLIFGLLLAKRLYSPIVPIQVPVSAPPSEGAAPNP